MDALISLFDVVSDYVSYIGGFITYLIELAMSFLDSGDILIFVLIILLVLKIKKNCV